MSSKYLDQKNKVALEENPTADLAADAAPSSVKGPVQFMFESEVDRIFSTPLGNHKKRCMFFCYTSAQNILLISVSFDGRINLDVCFSWKPNCLGKACAKLSPFYH